MTGRRGLKGSIQLCNESGGKRIFTVRKKIGSGGSVICYSAEYTDSAPGILKEFYPEDAAKSLRRMPNGQLVHTSDAEREMFEQAKNEYIEPFKKILEAERKNHDLAIYIPTFEIYYGCDDDGNRLGTVYIWTQQPELITFKKICDEVHKHPKVQPEYKMAIILTAIESLAKCINALHSCGLIHGDIKPSNFGFNNYGDETLTETLSLFDIDTICSIYSKKFEKTSEEYMDPVLLKGGKLSMRMDIYSIGATLFNALIITDEVKKGRYLYFEEYYPYLGDLVDKSELILASEANSHPSLRIILTKILKNCLAAERKNRYANCGELLEDLNLALFYVLPFGLAKRARSGEHWILAELEKSLDKNANKNSTAVIQYHLYKNPLYKYVSDDEKEINVLVLGLGNYGQKFLDMCLQIGQMMDKTLNVTVVTADECDKYEFYLKKRPELANFFNIDGGMFDTDESYGNINFVFKRFSDKSQKENKDILDEIIEKNYRGRAPHYAFIAMGYDNLNYSVAKTLCGVLKKRNMVCSVNMAQEETTEITTNKITPVCVNEDVKNTQLYKDIERMAFNVHIVWEKNLNLDYKEVREKFRKPYYHNSCITNVLSVKYKLYSLGIDLDKCGLDEAARILNDKILLSVKLHSLYYENAKITDKRDLINGREIKEIMSLVSNNKELISVFQEWYACVKDICNDEFAKSAKKDCLKKADLYADLKDKLLDITKSLGKENEKLLNEQVSIFHKKFYPILASMYYDLKNGLLYMEHRRWVAEKLCDDWIRLKDLKFCMNGDTKDEKGKRHICILKGRPDQILTEKFSENHYEKWDTATKEQLRELDDLDLLSVKLHRMYDENAKSINKPDLINGNVIKEIISLVYGSGNKELILAFQEWYACVKDICNDEFVKSDKKDCLKKADLYAGLKGKLLYIAKSLGKENEKPLKEQVSIFHKKFYPILASKEYKDFKLIDTKLIENIPFILTYTSELCMAIPYSIRNRDEAGDNTMEFGNVAAATVVNPKKIIYFVYLEKETDMENFESSIPVVENYMRKKQFNATVDFFVAYNSSTSGTVEAFENKLKEKKEKENNKTNKNKEIIKSFQFRKVFDEEDLQYVLVEYLESRKRRYKALAVEKNDSKLSCICTEIYKRFSSYTFVSSDMRFEKTNGCDMLRYIDKVPCITVGDMFAFGLASGRKLEQPEFYNDYNVLWKRYRKNTDLWKDLCGILSSHAKNNDDVIAKFDRSALLNDSDIKDCTYIIPYVCSSAVNKIVEKLKEIRCIGENSRIVGYTTDSCKVLIENRYDNSDEYEKLFSNVYVLQNADAVDVVEKKENNSVQVLFDNLVVKNVQIPTERFDSMLELIRFFEDKKYVMNLRVNKSEKTLSFTYATRQIKHLLTVEGSILEVYTYHKVKETGYFDDVVCNYEVSENGDEDAKNELDCVMTKGFNTVFVKCKARRNTEPSFYYKLLNLKAEFGINAKTVLIDDTAETKNYLKETANKDSGEMQGDRLNIITISNYEEIQNIGQVLSDIANGTYGKKQNIE